MCLYFFFEGRRCNCGETFCLRKCMEALKCESKTSLFFPLFARDWARFVNIRGGNKCMGIKVIAISFDLKRVFLFVRKNIVCVTTLLLWISNVQITINEVNTENMNIEHVYFFFCHMKLRPSFVFYCATIRANMCAPYLFIHSFIRTLSVASG